MVDTFVARDRARVQAHDPVGHARDRRVVRHEQHRVVPFTGQVVQHREDLPAGVEIEAAGRFVAQHERRLLHERARDRDPLLLTARQLPREPVGDVAEPDAGERGAAARLGVATGHLGEELHVLERGQGRHQVEELEHEPDPIPSVRGELVARQSGDVRAGDAAPGRSSLPRSRR